MVPFQKKNSGGAALLEAEEELPLVATRDKAAQEIHRQSMEGLVHVDDHDDLKIMQGVPAGFPTRIAEHGKDVEIVPFWVNLEEWGGHDMKGQLTPLTFGWCQTIPELKYLRRSDFNAQGYYQNREMMLCICPRKTYEKHQHDNPGTCEITLRALNAQANIQHLGENKSIIRTEEAGGAPGDVLYASRMTTVGELTEADAARTMRGE